VLAQPAAIKIVADFAKSNGAAKFFDAGALGPVERRQLVRGLQGEWVRQDL
jgi:hypothetical protein